MAPPWTYAVTFRIANKSVKGRSYDDRYKALVDAARLEKLGYWEETTSFFLVESNLSTNDFAARLSKALSEADDLLVVFDPSDLSACYFGPIKHPDILRSFFPLLIKVP